MKNLPSFLAFGLILSAFLSCTREAYDSASFTPGVEVVSSLPSSFSVISMAEDGEGFIWLGTMGNGLFRYDGTQYLHFFPAESPSSLSANHINHIFVDSRDRMWLSTQKGFDRYNGDLGFAHVNCDDSNLYAIQVAETGSGVIIAMTRRSVLVYNELTESFARKMYHPTLTSTDPKLIIDKDDKLWISYGNSLLCYDQTITQLASFEFENEISLAYDGEGRIFVKDGAQLRCIDALAVKNVDAPQALNTIALEGVKTLMNISNDLILIKTTSGSYCYDCKSSTLHDSSSNNHAYRIIMDKAGSRPFIYDEHQVLWLPDRVGLKQYLTSAEDVSSQFALGDFFSTHTISSYVTGVNYNWYLSRDGVIVTYDKINAMVSSYDNLSSLTDKALFAPRMRYDGSDHILVSGLGRANNHNYLLKTAEDGSLSLECVYAAHSGVVSDFSKDGSIWSAGAGSSLLSAPFPKKAEKYITFKPVMKPQTDNLSYATDIRTLRNGDLLVCYTDNPPVIVRLSSDETEVTTLSAPLSQVYYTCTLEDTEGNIWIGTSDNGLFVKERGEDGLVHIDTFGKGNITGIEQDVTGSVYVMYNFSKLYKSSVKDLDFSLIWSDARELPPMSSLIKMPDGSVALDKDDGLLTFNDESDMDRLDLSLVAASGRLPLAVFTSSDMRDGTYRMKIKSADENFNLRISPSWHNHGGYSYDFNYSVNRRGGAMSHSMNNPVLPLYNLRYGRNVIRFKVVNANTKSESSLHRIIVNVRVPVWLLLGMVSIVLMIVSITFLLLAHRKRKKEAEDERRERLIQEQINKGNVDFFANISHEFRTPLTLINGAVTMLGKGTGLSVSDTDRPVSIIRRNTARMLRLVSQMLDFNKLDHDMLKLNVATEDVSAVIIRVKELFDIGKDVKNIDFELTGCDTPILGYVDADKLEKILSNLLSNAFKFTSPGGTIKVIVEADENLTVKVQDSGIGLQEDKIDQLFERFYRMDSTSKSGGTGIGLCYTKGLVTLHHGTISAANHYETDASGHTTVAGAVFSFTVPVTASAYTEDEMAVTEDTMKAVDDMAYANEMSAFAGLGSAAGEGGGNKLSMLIIDDDYEMVYYLRSLFSPFCSVHFRIDAMSGYHRMEELNPDIVICDMMMIDVDGLQLCRMVKENLSLCHIPLIMLTAKSSLQDQIDSLNSGADAYVAKPFNPDYLVALVKSMVENRNRMRKLFTTSVATPKETVSKLSPMDKEFMDKIYEMMEGNIEDGQIDIDSMTEHLGVSRSKFYYKVKALTGQTPNDFFTTYKLNRAKELIEDGRYKISAIADMVGFSSGSYFANLFKKKFGVLPSQYRENRESGTNV